MAEVSNALHSAFIGLVIDFIQMLAVALIPTTLKR